MAKDSLDFSIKFDDNTIVLEKEFGEATERALYAIGVKAVEGATDAISGRYTVPSAVDTGRLRASISFITPQQSGNNGEAIPPNGKASDRLSGAGEKNTTIVGSNVEYAEYVHNGTSKMSARPFLREGIDKKKDVMKEQVEKIFKGEL